jgi:hypothetical protein
MPTNTWFGNEFTIEAWVYARTNLNFMRFIDFGNAGCSDSVMLCEDQTGTKPSFIIFYGTSSSKVLTSPQPLPLNQWVHLAATFKTNTGILYVNGFPMATNAVMPPPNPVNRTNNYVARSNWPGDPAVNAMIDDVRIWNMARATNDIQADLLQPWIGPDAGPVADWKFDEGSGLIAHDATTNHQDGTLVNGPTWVVSTVPAFTWTTNNGTITITVFTGAGGAVVVPNRINGLPVISIGVGAFQGCTSLTSVKLSDNLTTIGDYVFSMCQHLTSITIPDNVTNIGWWAFQACPSLTNVVLGNNVTTIGYQAFSGCTSLVNVTFPSSVSLIHDEAFLGCGSLRGVYFQGNAPNLGGTYAFGDPGLVRATAYCLPGTAGWDTFNTHSGLNFPAVLWNAQVQTGDGNFGVRTNRFGFTITGTANIPIVVEACTNLVCPAWTPLQSCTMTNGSISFCDSQWTNYRARFYHIRWP